jgi:hypothetical protein
MEEACAISNRIAPEHLEISSREPQRWEPLLKHAGAIFLGAFTSESLGDYCAGPNHVLPTSGTARFSSPLGVYDFRKRSADRGQPRLAGARPIAPSWPRRRAAGHARGAEMRSRPRRRRHDALAGADDGAAADVQSMHGYAVQPSPAWSSWTRWRTRSACRGLREALGERLARWR